MKRLLNVILPLFIFLASGISFSGSESETVQQIRRQALLSQTDEGVFVFFSSQPSELDYLARQDNTFFYLTGIETMPSILLLTKDTEGKTHETLYLPRYSSHWERWNGYRHSYFEDSEKNAALAEELGFEKTAANESFAQSLHRAISRSSRHLYLDYQEVPMDDPLDFRMQWLQKFKDRYPDAITHKAGPMTDALRLVKDKTEIEKIQKAVDATGIGLRKAMKQMRPGMMEYEIEAVIEGTFRSLGTSRIPAFPAIVGSGINSTTLHYSANNSKIKKGVLIVMDVGADYGYYDADVTRTIPATGKFSKRQREIYQIVLEAQKLAMEGVKPGATIKEIDKIAKDYIKEKGYEDYFFHGTSHYLGMDVHDVGKYKEPFVPGVVLTVEPGIYLSDEALGVRIEDDVVVTEDGYKCLSCDIPKEIEAIEALMSQ